MFPQRIIMVSSIFLAVLLIAGQVQADCLTDAEKNMINSLNNTDNSTMIGLLESICTRLSQNQTVNSSSSDPTITIILQDLQNNLSEYQQTQKIEQNKLQALFKNFAVKSDIFDLNKSIDEAKVNTTNELRLYQNDVNKRFSEQVNPLHVMFLGLLAVGVFVSVNNIYKNTPSKSRIRKAVEDIIDNKNIGSFGYGQHVEKQEEEPPPENKIDGGRVPETPKADADRRIRKHVRPRKK